MEVDYTETHGRGIAISKSKQGRDHVTEGEIAHIEMGDGGLMTVYFRAADQPGGGIVSHSNHTVRYLDDAVEGGDA